MERKRETFYKLYKNEEDFKLFRTEDIYQCEDDEPPSRETASVNELCTVNYNLDILYDSLEDFTGANGKMLKKFTYGIEMIPSGASNVFSIFYKGKKLASKDAHIDFQ